MRPKERLEKTIKSDPIPKTPNPTTPKPIKEVHILILIKRLDSLEPKATEIKI